MLLEIVVIDKNTSVAQGVSRFVEALEDTPFRSLFHIQERCHALETIVVDDFFVLRLHVYL